MADKYKLLGSNRQGERMDRLELRGDKTEDGPTPETVVLLRGGEPVELTDELVEKAKSAHARLRKVSDNESDTTQRQEQQAEQAGGSTTAGASTTGARTPAAKKPTN